MGETLPPTIRLEIEWGDRRAVAELPPDVGIAYVQAAADWLAAVSNDWTVR